MSDNEKKNDELFQIVGIDKIPEDEFVPDSVPHMVYLRFNGIDDNDPDDVSRRGQVVSVLCNGSQWDMMWWVYRISEEFENMTFEDFLALFIGEIYESYRRG